MRTDDFDFFLPDSLIAQFPTQQRRASRLLHVNGINGTLSDNLFASLPDLLMPGDLLVFNDTRVIKARLYGRKASGGQIEALIERVMDEHEALAHIRASKAPKPGTRLIFADSMEAEVLARQDDLFRLRFLGSTPVATLLEQFGKLPLPPYIQHQASTFDEGRYQTVYARQPGAVAAPTAGLHFDEGMMAELESRNIHIAYITLHVGSGTFLPVRVQNLADHKMHSERYHIPQTTVDAIQRAQANNDRIIAVGTTVLRTLESAASNGALEAGENETSIFITPGFQFRIVERLLTNFHLPKSTLLMLVSAFGGTDTLKKAYLHAVNEKYRFFSYGDAMLIERQHIERQA